MDFSSANGMMEPFSKINDAMLGAPAVRARRFVFWVVFWNGALLITRLLITDNFLPLFSLRFLLFSFASRSFAVNQTCYIFAAAVLIHISQTSFSIGFSRWHRCARDCYKMAQKHRRVTSGRKQIPLRTLESPPNEINDNYENTKTFAFGRVGRRSRSDGERSELFLHAFAAGVPAGRREGRPL
jgi:hypothetical protein